NPSKAAIFVQQESDRSHCADALDKVVMHSPRGGSLLQEIGRPAAASTPNVQIASMDVRNGATEILVDGSGTNWSPQFFRSNQVAYVSATGLERLNGPRGARGEFGSPSWSPDERKVVFHRETDTVWPPFWGKEDLGSELSIDPHRHLSFL